MGSFGSVLRVHMRRMMDRLEYKVAFCLFSAACCLSFIEECVHYLGFDKNALPSAALGWIGHYISNDAMILPTCLLIFFPLLASLAYADAPLVDARRGTAHALATRTCAHDYLLASALCAFAGAFVLFVVPLLVTQVLAFIVFPVETPEFGMQVSLGSSLDYPSAVEGYLLGSMQVSVPYLYNVVRTLYVGVFAGSVALVTLAVSLYVPWGRIQVLGLTSLIYLVCTLVLPAGLRPALFLLPNLLGISPALAVWLVCPVVLVAGSLAAILYAASRRDVFL